MTVIMRTARGHERAVHSLNARADRERETIVSSSGVTDLRASRALDARIHVHVLGREVKWLGDRPVDSEHARQVGSDTMARAVPSYSTDIAAAFPLLERFERFSRVERLTDHPPHHWAAMVKRGEHLYFGEAETAALAICRAALKAAEATEESQP